MKYLDLGSEFWEIKINFWVLVVFMILSIIAIRKIWAFYGINILGIVFILASIRV
jgi:hypothetical protein